MSIDLLIKTSVQRSQNFNLQPLKYPSKEIHAIPEKVAL